MTQKHNYLSYKTKKQSEGGERGVGRGKVGERKSGIIESNLITIFCYKIQMHVTHLNNLMLLVCYFG